MSQSRLYRIDRFEITVNHRSYVVGVRESNESTRTQDNYSDLPSWIFESKHAIWFADGNSLMEKASQGEQIKKQLLTRYF